MDWIGTLIQELAKVGKWLFTPITFGYTQEEYQQMVDLNDRDYGVILGPSGFQAGQVYNFFARLFSGNWDYSTPPEPLSITPIYLIGATFITALFIALFIKVWIRR